MVDVNKPVTNPELVEIMNEFLNDKSAENEIKFIEKITKANFLTPIIMNGEIENGVLKAGSTISFKMITNTADESFFLAFTDWEELGKWSKEKEQTLITTYEDFRNMLFKDSNAAKGFVINPFGQNIVITPELMEYFSTRKSEVIIKKDTKIMLGQPANYPHDMINALSAFFKKHKEVKSAYMFQIHREDEEKPNLLFVVDFTGEKSELFPQIAAVAQSHLSEGEFIEIVPRESNFGMDATKDAEPFYKKKVLGFI